MLKVNELNWHLIYQLFERLAYSLRYSLNHIQHSTSEIKSCSSSNILMLLYLYYKEEQ
jgi:hypothetical protein